MKMKAWVDEIKKVLSEIGDEEFQRKYWISGDKKVVSSFEETINRLFDDLDFDTFIKKYEESGNDDPVILQSLTLFRKDLNSYLAQLPSVVDPKAVILNDEWKNIVLQANKLAAELQGSQWGRE